MGKKSLPIGASALKTENEPLHEKTNSLDF